MTTFFNFQPTNGSNYSFQPTLDGATYQAVVPWLLFGQRWYLALTALNGTLVFYRSLIGSPTGLNVESLSWANGYVTLTTSIPHGYRVGQTVQLIVKGCSPDTYNGTFSCLIINTTQLVYQMSADPGQASGFGQVSYDVNLAWGYFQQSTLIYRPSSQQFEVTP